MNGVTAVISAMRTLDAKALSELALALCLAGAIIVWIGLRFDRQVFRWAGITVIIAGLVGLIFQNSLSRQTLAQPGVTLPSARCLAEPLPVSVPEPDPQAEAQAEAEEEADPQAAPAAVGRRVGWWNHHPAAAAPATPAAAAPVLAFPRQALRARRLLLS